jgi:hypothetical protein
MELAGLPELLAAKFASGCQWCSLVQLACCSLAFLKSPRNPSQYRTEQQAEQRKPQRRRFPGRSVWTRNRRVRGTLPVPATPMVNGLGPGPGPRGPGAGGKRGPRRVLRASHWHEPPARVLALRPPGPATGPGPAAAESGHGEGSAGQFTEAPQAPGQVGRATPK